MRFDPHENKTKNNLCCCCCCSLADEVNDSDHGYCIMFWREHVSAAVHVDVLS